MHTSSIYPIQRAFLFSIRPRAPVTTISPCLRAKSAVAADEVEVAATRSWLSAFKLESIPKQACELSFSRSSGPGGQNVNKVSSKATLRVRLATLLQGVPQILHAPIRACSYATRGDELVIQSDESRKQGDNVQQCFVKLHRLIADIGRSTIPGETSIVQRKKVERLASAGNQARLHAKKQRSATKSSRRMSSE